MTQVDPRYADALAHAQRQQQMAYMRYIQGLQQQQMMQQQQMQQMQMMMAMQQQQAQLTPDEQRRQAVQRAGIESSRQREMEMRKEKQFYREPDALERYEQQRQQMQMQQQQQQQMPGQGMSEEKIPNFSPDSRTAIDSGKFNTLAGMDVEAPTDTGAAAAQAKSFSARPNIFTGKVSVYGGPGRGFIKLDDNDERLSITRTTARAAERNLQKKKEFFDKQQPDSEVSKIINGQIARQKAIADGSPVTSLQSRLQRDNRIADRFGKIADNERILQDMSGIPDSYQTQRESVQNALDILGHPLAEATRRYTYRSRSPGVKPASGFKLNLPKTSSMAQKMQAILDGDDAKKLKQMNNLVIGREEDDKEFRLEFKTAASREKFRKMMNEDVQVDEAMAPFNPMGGGKRKPATNIGKDLRNQLQMTKPSEYSFSAPAVGGGRFAVIPIKSSRPSSQAGVMMAIFDKRGKVTAYYGTHMDTDSAKKFAKRDGLIESAGQLDEMMLFTFDKSEDAFEFTRQAVRKRLASSADNFVDYKLGKAIAEIQPPVGAVPSKPSRVHTELAKLLKQFGGKFLRSNEGKALEKVFERFETAAVSKTRESMRKPMVKKTKFGFQVMVYSPTKKGYIAQGQPHKTKAAAEKDAKMFESVQIDEDINESILGKLDKVLDKVESKLDRLARAYNNLPRNKAKLDRENKERMERVLKNFDNMVAELDRMYAHVDEEVQLDEKLVARDIQGMINKLDKRAKQEIADALNGMNLGGYGDYEARADNVHKFKPKDLMAAMSKVMRLSEERSQAYITGNFMLQGTKDENYHKLSRAKLKNLYNQAKPKRNTRDRAFEITFADEAQFRQFMKFMGGSKFVTIMKYPVISESLRLDPRLHELRDIPDAFERTRNIKSVFKDSDIKRLSKSVGNEAYDGGFRGDKEDLPGSVKDMLRNIHGYSDNDLIVILLADIPHASVQASMALKHRGHEVKFNPQRKSDIKLRKS